MLRQQNLFHIYLNLKELYFDKVDTPIYCAKNTLGSIGRRI